MRKGELDEMQVQRRNKIGNQSFMLLFYLLMIDIGLYGFGFRWVKYPTNVFIIMLACMTYYLIRLILNSAYVGPQNNQPLRKKVVFGVAIIAAVVSATILISQQNFIKAEAVDVNDNSALILFIFGIVSLFISLVVSIIVKKQNSKGDE